MTWNQSGVLWALCALGWGVITAVTGLPSAAVVSILCGGVMYGCFWLGDKDDK